MRWIVPLLFVLGVSPLLVEPPATLARSIEETVGDLRRVVADVDQRRAHHYHASTPGSDELHRRALAAYRALELARGLLADYQAGLRQQQAAVPTLAPASGFAGPTAQPDHIGTGFGADAKAIARWNVVPWQAFDGTFEVGVLAFHIKDIDRVEFAVNGGDWLAVEEKTRNPRTGVDEYWVRLDAADFDDGPVEVRAVAYPVRGLPRVVQSLALVANAQGNAGGHELWVSPDGSNETGDGTRANPYASIFWAASELHARHGTAAGGTVYLEPGDYNIMGHRPERRDLSATEAWLTVSGAPDVDRSEVRITEAGPDYRLNVRRLRLANLTVVDGVRIFQSGTDKALWFDGCVLEGHVTKATATDFRQGIYITGCEYPEGARGVIRASMLRDVTLRHFVGTVMQNIPLAINVHADGISDGGDSSVKADFIQWHGGGGLQTENVIYLNVSAVNNASQGLMIGGGTLDNVALIDSRIENHHAHMTNQWAARSDHVVMRNVDMPHKHVRLRGSAQWTNSLIDGGNVRLQPDRNEMIEEVTER